jgi:hypothetical protein
MNVVVDRFILPASIIKRNSCEDDVGSDRNMTVDPGYKPPSTNNLSMS